jgi:hypothetical protein
MNSDGSTDNSFNIGAGFSVNDSNHICLAANNGYLVGGGFTSYSGSAGNPYFAVINQDGTRQA